jgi:hypothetical protein
MPGDNEYMRKYMAARYKRRKALAIKRLGGKCVECGSKKRLQFDHKKRRGKGKDFVITRRLAGVAEHKLLEEIDKCQLLCLRCHQKKTLVELGYTSAFGTHGTLSAYRYCGPPKCPDCKKAHNAYCKAWKRNRKRSQGLQALTVKLPALTRKNGVRFSSNPQQRVAPLGI